MSENPPLTVGTYLTFRQTFGMYLADRNVAELSLLMGVHVLLATVVFLPGTPLDALRPVVAFFYLLFVPGLLLVSVFRLYQEDPLAQLVTAVGLSLIYIMVLGLALSGIPAKRRRRQSKPLDQISAQQRYREHIPTFWKHWPRSA